MAILSISLYSSLVLSFAALIAYSLVGAVYRLRFSPISKFPGPKLAALTFWYEFYYDVILRGQYLFHLRGLHDKYGPIIRINPYELHISDATFYEKLYASSASGEKRDKWGWYTKQFITSGAIFSTTGHDHHRARRAALNPFFSMASTRRLQPVVNERVEQLVGRIREFKDTEELVKMNLAFAAFTNDVVQEYAYGNSDRCIEKRDFDPTYHDALATAARLGNLLKQMIWVFHALQSLPQWLVARIAPDLDLCFRLQQKVENRVRKVMNEPSIIYKELSHPTIFHEVLHSSLPDAEKTVVRLRDEAWIVVAGGTLTTAWTLSVAFYHLLASPRILAQLKAELRSAIPASDGPIPPLHVLEKIPMLVAVVQEALRLSYGVTGRSQRIAPNPLNFTDRQSGTQWTIPPNTPTSITSVDVHHDETIFPDSHCFIPGRWIKDPRLDRYLVSFSKGSRGCIGINLAYAEIYLCLAMIFRRFGSGGKDGVRHDTDEGVLELWETDVSDVTLVGDGFTPLVRKGSQGIRIKVRS